MGAALSTLSGCVGPHSCNPRESAPETEQPSTDFDLCGTTLRWSGSDDSLEVVRVGKIVDRWDELRVALPRPPNPTPPVLGIEFGKPASNDSPRLVSDTIVPFSDYAPGTIDVGESFHFCRIEPARAARVYLAVRVNLTDLSGGAMFPAEVRAC